MRCQLCDKPGHTVLKCYKRFDSSYVGPEKSSTAATTSYDIDTNWYADSGSTDHITSELERLSVRDKYSGHDQVHTTSGTCMEIDHIGHATFRTPHRDLALNNVLHVPSANTYFLFVALFSIMMSFWNFILNIFLLRICKRGELCSTASLEEVSTPLPHSVNNTSVQCREALFLKMAWTSWPPFFFCHAASP